MIAAAEAARLGHLSDFVFGSSAPGRASSRGFSALAIRERSPSNGGRPPSASANAKVGDLTSPVAALDCSAARAVWIPCVASGDPNTGEFRRVEGPPGFGDYDDAVEASWFRVRRRRWRAVLGVLWVVIGVAGCGAGLSPAASTQQECERYGGVWRSGICERTGGGY
jgi:hypothetical protein